MTGAVGGAAAALVINLRRRNVPVAEQSLHGTDIGAAIEQQGGGSGAQRVRGVDAPLFSLAVLADHFLDCSWYHFFHRGRETAKRIQRAHPLRTLFARRAAA